MFKKASAREVHLYIASPPYRYPCYYGVDIRCSGQLAVNNFPHNLAESTGRKK